MRKIVLVALVVILVILMTMPVQALAMYISIYDEDGRTLITDTPAELLGFDGENPIVFVNDGYLMLPLRLIAEYYGAQVEWHAPRAIVTLEDTHYTLQADSKTVLINTDDNELTELLPQAALIKSDRLFVPLQFFSDIMGREVEYEGLDWLEHDPEGPFLPHELRSGIVLGELLYDDPYYFEHRFGDWLDSYKDMTKEEKTEIMRSFEERFAQTNSYSFAEVMEINHTYLSNPISEIVNYRINLSVASYSEIPDESTELWINSINELSDARFSEEALESHGWNEFLCLTKFANYDIYFSIVNTRSTSNVITGTFFCYLNNRIATLPLLLEAELIRQDGGEWLITNITNPRSYLNMHSLAMAEPEVFEQIVSEHKYSYIYYLLSSGAARTAFDYFHSDSLRDNIQDTIVMNIGERAFLVDGYVMEGPPPVYENGAAWTPLRSVFQAMGYQVIWLDSEKKAVITYDDNDDNDDKTFEVYLTGEVTLNGEMIAGDMPVKMIGGRIYLSAESMGELLGRSVKYIENLWPSEQIDDDFRLIIFYNSSEGVYYSQYFDYIQREFTAYYWAIKGYEPPGYMDEYLLLYNEDGNTHILSRVSETDVPLSEDAPDGSVHVAYGETLYNTPYGYFLVGGYLGDGEYMPSYRYKDGVLEKILDAGIVREYCFAGNYLYLIFSGGMSSGDWVDVREHSNLLQINLEDLTMRYLGAPNFLYRVSEYSPESTWEVREDGVYIFGRWQNPDYSGSVDSDREESWYFLVDLEGNGHRPG